jgi:putative inorganic carbon (hco3(-)) transporter
VGFALTVVYIVATIISPEQFGPAAAQYHPLLYLAAITFLFSMPDIFKNTYLGSSTQTYLLLGFIVAIGLSGIANGWSGGVINSWQKFLPSAAVFFFIVANVTTIRRLKIVALSVVASSLVVVVEALCGYYGGFRSDMFVLQQSLYSHDDVVGQLTRLRGAGFLNDPNDLAQILLIALPLIFVAWDKRRGIANKAFVLVPASLLLWAIYLTHSRGALIALAVLTLMATRRRIGTTASVVLIVALIVSMLVLDFTGGRGISAVEGSDRIEAWAHGLGMFKSAPLFGIGFGSFTDLNDITAHNSFVLCLAELGLVGSTIWVALLVTTMISLSKIIGQAKAGQAETASAGKAEQDEEATFLDVAASASESLAIGSIENTIVGETGVGFESAEQSIVPKHWVIAMRMALVAFIATGWFLSRSYNTPMYLILGLATAVIGLQEPVTKTWARGRWIVFTLAFEAAAIMVIYGIVRFQY